MKYKTIDEICDIFDNLRKPITGKNREKGVFLYYESNGGKIAFYYIFLNKEYGLRCKQYKYYIVLLLSF